MFFNFFQRKVKPQVAQPAVVVDPIERLEALRLYHEQRASHYAAIWNEYRDWRAYVYANDSARAAEKIEYQIASASQPAQLSLF